MECEILTAMLTCGAQITAARGLVGISRAELSKACGVHMNTLTTMEGKGLEQLDSLAKTVAKVQQALEALGVEFLNHGQPGVRIRART